MSEIKHTSGPWYAVQPDHCNGWWIVSNDPEGHDCVDDSGDGGFEEHKARFISAAPDMAEILEIIAADADAGTIMLTSGVRLAIDAALIKAGRKKAPEPVRHFTINGGV
jgi:hypothetical protein